jgi:hypothetical protein
MALLRGQPPLVYFSIAILKNIFNLTTPNHKRTNAASEFNNKFHPIAKDLLAAIHQESSR